MQLRLRAVSVAAGLFERRLQEQAGPVALPCTCQFCQDCGGGSGGGCLAYLQQLPTYSSFCPLPSLWLNGWVLVNRMS